MFLQEIIQNIIPFYLMIVNYDKKNGWSSVFDGGINSFFKGNLNESDASFVKNIKTIQNSLGTISSKNIDRLANSIGGVSTELVDSAKAVRSGKQSWADFDNTVVSVTKSTSKFSSFTAKAGSALKSFGSSVLSMGANMLAGMAIGAAISGVVALIDHFIVTYDELQNKFQESQSKYDSAKSELSSVQSELDQVNARIEEINSQPLSFANEAELATLQSQRAELEQMVKIKENLVEASKNQLAYDALNAANAETSALTALTAGRSDSVKTMGSFLDWYLGDDTIPTIVRTLGGGLPGGVFSNKLSDEWTQYTDQDIVGIDTKRINELKKQQQELYDWLASDEGLKNAKGNTDLFKEKQEELERVSQGITDLQTEIATKQSLIASQIEAMTDESGNALPGFEEKVASLKDTLNELAHFDTTGMSDIEKSFNAIDKYFGQSSTSGLKNYFQELANEGKLTSDAIEEIGLSADTIGTDNLADVVRYFNDMAVAADEAADAVSGVDGSFEGVQAAFESENQGAEWNAMAGYVSQLQELYEAGKVGTDEFQSGVQYFIPEKINEDAYKYDADAYVEAWESARKKIKRYFDEENPLESMTNLTNDLIDAGKASQVGDEITWQFKTTAEAADALGLSVQATESALHNLEEYGAEFDDVMFSGEGLERYETALSGLKSLYDSMDEGESKDRLGGLIENWDTELEKYQNDMSLLTEDQIVKIEFEYDLASIQQQIDQLDQAWESGDRSAETGAARIVGKTQYRETREKQTGYNESADQAYAATYAKIEELQSQFNSEIDESQRQSIQNQISAILDLQNAFQDLYSDGGVKNWDEFLGTDKFQLAVDSIISETGITKNELAGLLDINSEDLQLKIDVELSKDELDDQLESLSEGETLTISAKVDGKDLDISALKDEDGTITYTAEIDGVEKQLSLVQNEDGTISFTADTSNVDAEVAKTDGGSRTTTLTPNSSAVDSEVAKTDGGNRTTKFNPDSSQVDAETAKTNGGHRTTIYSANTASLPTYFSPIIRTVQYVVSWIGDKLSGGSGLAGTAHIDGTVNGLYPIPKLSGRALAMGSLQDESWLNPNWRTKKSEVALTGEEGQELVVTRANRWFTVGDHGAEFANIPQGSIIFNAQQTKELLSKGKINSRGTAMIGGTAYANGWRLPSTSSNSSSSSGSSSNKSSNKSSSNKSTSKSTQKAAKSVEKAAKSTEKAAKSTEKAADKFEESFDEIEILLDRMDRSLQNLTDSIETYSYDLSKQSSVSDKAMNMIRTNLSTLQQAYNRYIQEANSVGLDESWKQRIENGSIDITTIASEELSDKLSEYQKW